MDDLQKAHYAVVDALKMDEYGQFDKVEIASGPHEVDLIMGDKRFRVSIHELELKSTIHGAWWVPKK